MKEKMYTLLAPVSRPIRFIYHKMHWFTDKEAWMLFRLFAFVEAIGWTMLISAIIYRKLDMPGNEIAISIAGTTHGLFFSLYFLFVLLTARSMEWGLRRVTGALISGMPPYTALLFEKVMSHHRQKYPPNIDPPKNSE